MSGALFLLAVVGCGTDDSAPIPAESLEQIDGVWVGEQQSEAQSYAPAYEWETWEVTFSVFAADASIEIDWLYYDDRSFTTYEGLLACSASVPVPGLLRQNDCKEVDRMRHGDDGEWEELASYAASEYSISPVVVQGELLGLPPLLLSFVSREGS